MCYENEMIRQRLKNISFQQVREALRRFFVIPSISYNYNVPLIFLPSLKFQRLYICTYFLYPVGECGGVSEHRQTAERKVLLTHLNI